MKTIENVAVALALAVCAGCGGGNQSAGSVQSVDSGAQGMQSTSGSFKRSYQYVMTGSDVTTTTPVVPYAPADLHIGENDKAVAAAAVQSLIEAEQPGAVVVVSTDFCTLGGTGYPNGGICSSATITRNGADTAELDGWEKVGN